LVQSGDPLIVSLAAEAAGDERDPWRTSIRLERFVKQSIRSKNFSQAFASAAEVARTREGDCTEHAVLLAALARARGIAARVAMGLVYTEQPPGQPLLAFHMWTEAYVAGRWIPLDATLGQGGIGAAHLKLAQSSLAGPDAFAGFLPIAQVLGRLRVTVLHSE
jgi:transglutaminase-like putative cysteine protease